jgi:hypothetical protein
MGDLGKTIWRKGIAMRTVFALSWLGAVILIMPPPIYATPYSGGSSATADPTQISAVADRDMQFILTADVDFYGIETEKGSSMERAISPNQV